VEIPRPKGGEVLLLIGAAGICGSDLHIIAGEYPCYPPVILGHEFAGTIVELGEGVAGWSVGDRVTSMPYAVVCGACEYCQKGEFGLCASRRSYGSGVNGAFAQYLNVKAGGLYRIPDHHDFVAGALTEPLACVTKAVCDVGGLKPGETVVIMGPGPIGLLATQVVKATGAYGILIGLKSDADRLALGRKLAAQQTLFADDPDVVEQVRDSLKAGGADVVFECSGAASALKLALELARKKGRIIQVGLFGKSIPLDVDPLVFKDLTIRGSFASSTSSWKRALELTWNRQVDTRSLVSDLYPLEAVEQAFTQAMDRSHLKVVFQP
jgi:L-iditol 2-dehydrogenase